MNSLNTGLFAGCRAPALHALLHRECVSGTFMGSGTGLQTASVWPREQHGVWAVGGPVPSIVEGHGAIQWVVHGAVTAQCKHFSHFTFTR